MSHDIQASPTTSYEQEVSSKAYDRLQCIRIQFVSGVKSLYDFGICLHEPIFNRNKLQKLSENAIEQISLAEQEIKKGEVDIINEIDRLILKRQNIETDMDDTNSKIISLTQSIQIKEDDIKRTNNDVQSAKRIVELHEEQEKEAETKATVASFTSVVIAVVGGAATVGVTVLSAGIAAPAAAAGFYAAVTGASTIVAGVTCSNLTDARKALQEKIYALKEHKIDLNREKMKFTYAKNELKNKQEIFRNIEDRNSTNHDNLKVITKLKSSVSQCHDYVNITLGRVEILREMKKKEHYKTSLKMILDQVIMPLSEVSAIEGIQNYIQPIERMAIEMNSLSNQ